MPQLEPLTDEQIASVNNLRLSSEQAEDALSQGLDKLQQSLLHNIAADPMGVDNFGFQMAASMEKIEALEFFVNQVIYLRIMINTINFCHFLQCEVKKSAL